jgi:hypothetical protein
MTSSVYRKKNVPSRGPVKSSQSPKPSPPKNEKQSPTCPNKAGTSLSEKIFVPGHLDTLICGWWEHKVRVPGVPLAAEIAGEMGERYKNNGGGGNFGREGGGPSRQHQFGG